MNERIRELIEQAGWTEGYYESDDGPFIEPEFNKEKFAELIIRECIKVVDDTMTENQEMNIGLVMASAAIIAHFGVEE